MSWFEETGKAGSGKPPWGFSTPASGAPASGAPASGFFSKLGNAIKGGVRRAVAEASPAPVSTGPNPWDLSTPGTGELTHDILAKSFSAPLPGRHAMEGALGQLQKPTDIENYWDLSMPGILKAAGPNNPLAGAYRSFKANRPDLAQDPGLAPFYETAKRRALEDVNTNAAARGAYGSSAALDQGTEVVSTLEADRAAKEADYRLRTAAENRAWEGLGGDLAGALSADRRGWTNTAFSGALGASTAATNRLLGVLGGGSDLAALELRKIMEQMKAAERAQILRENRISTAFDITRLLGNDVAGQVFPFVNDTYEEQFSTSDAATQADLAGANASHGFSERRKAGIGRGITDAAKFFALGGA